ncbi:MAG: hypothetical protein ACXAEN_22500 [Candidatus Thorarchaeota archaeon]|jgi:hypothetical protein
MRDPQQEYRDTKANIEALTTANEGAIGYATDTDELGTYDGSTWYWESQGWTKITAASVNITAGGTDASSVVANLQTENDGNIFHLDEVAATPGSDFYVEFTSVVQFKWVKVRGNYVGGATHGQGILLYDWVGTAWDHKDCLQTSAYDATAEQEVICNQSFFVEDDDNYIGTGGDAGKVRVRIVHPMNGNTAHDIYMDVVALFR